MLEIHPTYQVTSRDANTSILSYLFAKWGFDLIGPLSTVPGGLIYAVVAVDYFIKWLEAQPLKRITVKHLISFVEKSIIFRFGMPQSLVSDNTLQFENEQITKLYLRYGIQKDFLTPMHP